MELTLKTDLRIGQTLYYLESKEKNVYKPCPACDNQRKVEFQHNGHIFTADCPKCTGKQIKGDESNFITTQEYSVSDTEIRRFECSDNESFTINGDIYIETLISKDGWRGKKQYYISKDEAAKTAKELNKQEKQKANDFLKESVANA